MSVQDVLENEEIKLDSVFKFSLIQDLVRVRPLCISSIPQCLTYVSYLRARHILSSFQIIFDRSNVVWFYRPR